MTARIVGSLRPTAAYANAETRANRISLDRAIGIRDTEYNAQKNAELRLWGSFRQVPAVPSTIIATGRMFPAEIQTGDPEVWNGAGHRGIVWTTNDGEYID